MFSSLRPLLPAVVLALLTILFGHFIGMAFGLLEEDMKQGLQASADAVLADVYQGDAAKAKSVVDKSWSYYKRAHLHAGALGTTALVVALLLAFLPGLLRVRQAAGVAVGAGGLGYSVFWLLAGMRAPALGGTGAAKEALAWLAQPSAFLVVAGVITTLVLVGRAFFTPKEEQTEKQAPSASSSATSST